MDWEEVLAHVIDTLFRIVLVVVIPYLAVIVKQRVNNQMAESYIDRAMGIVENAVLYIDQTYVNGLKREGKFDKAAQEEAFAQCRDYVLQLLSEESKKAIIDACGDLETWVRIQIESAVLVNK